MQFNDTPLVVEQNNYATKIVNTFIVYDLDNLPKIPLRNFALKNCLFGATNIAKNSYKSKWVYSGYGIAFDRLGSWSLINEFGRNVITFVVDNSSSSHANNCKNKFLVLGEEPTV